MKLIFILLIAAAAISSKAQQPFPFPPPALSNGLNYSYYEGVWDVLPDFSTLTKVRKDSIKNFNISGATRTENYAFVFTGFLFIPADGFYNFYLASDDGSALSIDTALLVSNDGMHSFSEKQAAVHLITGMHPIEVKFFNKQGDKGLTLRWDGPSTAKQLIPDAALFKRAQMVVVYPVHMFISDTSTTSTGAYRTSAVLFKRKGFVRLKDMTNELNPDAITFEYLDEFKRPLDRRFCVLKDFPLSIK